MRLHASGLLLLSSLGAIALAACATGNDEAPGSASSNVDGAESDLELAKKSVALLQGDDASLENGKCNGCHTAGKNDIKRWGAAFTAIDHACLDPSSSLTAAQRIDCLRKDPTNPASPFSARKLGLYAAGASGADFEALFKAAYPADQWSQRFKDFKTKAAMPAFNRPGLTAAELATVKKWAQRGLPKLDDVLPDLPGQVDCHFEVSPELSAHIDRMKTSGWGARLADASTPMAGCGAETDAAKCLKSFPDITSTWGVEGTRQTLRQLRKLGFTTDFWVRSSPDGRFTSFGGSPSRIIDNTAPSGQPVEVDAPYDPGYFPNNDGFSFAGTNAGGLRVCRQSVLLEAFQNHSRIRMNEAGCTEVIDTVYQSVGASLDGSLYFMATGTHTDDSGDNDGPLDAEFGVGAATTLTPMFNDGTRYVPGRELEVSIPNEGDQQLSPSNLLLVTRFGSKNGKAGYHFRMLTPHVSGTGTTPNVTVDAKIVGTACIAGGKPQLSFDERFLAVHQYVDSNANPGHLPERSSNIFLVDLKTGKTTQLTKMKAGQHALYPHWRADGWLYFLVRDGNTNKETLVASDAALHVD